MKVRYVILDPQYFLLVEVDQADLLERQRREKLAEGAGENKIATVRSQTVVDMRNANVTIQKKVPLRDVECLVDRSEPRNLILGFVYASKASTTAGANSKQNSAAKKKSFFRQPNAQVQMMPATENLEEMLLYFEHHTKCTYVKNMLDLNKQSLRKRIVNQAK